MPPTFLSPSNGPRSLPWLICISIALVVFTIGSVLILACVPPVSRDALTHHLALPKLYLQHGGMYEIPTFSFSYYPQNLDLLYIIPLYFGSDIIPKYIHFGFALITAWLIHSYLRQRLGSLYGVLGALVFLSLPIVIKLSITVYVDLGLICFSTAAIIHLLKWIENQFKLRYLLYSGVWCGLALGTKYNGLIVLFLLTVFVPFIYSKIRHGDGRTEFKGRSRSLKWQMKAVGYSLLFFSVACLVFSPWMVRNYQWKKNPVYPLYNSFFQQNKGLAGENP